MGLLQDCEYLPLARHDLELREFTFAAYSSHTYSMVRLGRWKSGLALLIMLHLLVHPAIHVHRTSGLLGTSTSHSLIRDEAAHPDDVCSLCRVANALHVPAPSLAGERLLLQGDGPHAEAASAPRAPARWQRIPRAPPISVNL